MVIYPPFIDDFPSGDLPTIYSFFSQLETFKYSSL
jgi:hypothetical protein